MWLAQRHMEGYVSGVGIERVQTSTTCHPKDSVSVLAARLDVIAAQAEPITGVVTEAGGFSRVGVQSAQAMPGGQPQHSVGIFVDMSSCTRQVRYRFRHDLIVNETPGRRRKSIQTGFAAHPQRSRAVLEQR